MRRFGVAVCIIDGNARYVSNQMNERDFSATRTAGHIADVVRAMKPGIEPALKQPGDDLYQRAVVANVRYNVQRLLEAKPILADMVAAKKLSVVGGVYELASGKVTPV
jgi:carbonic anhydrase